MIHGTSFQRLISAWAYPRRQSWPSPRRTEILIRSTRAIPLAIVSLVLMLGSARVAVGQPAASKTPMAATPDVAVGAQYDSTHVYVAYEDVNRFVASVVAIFGGATSKQVVTTATPTPSSTISQIISTPVGMFSVFGYKTPVPYPFGAERTGYLVTDMDAAISTARTSGAYVLVAPFKDPIGRDAVIEFPGGVNTQLYIHNTVPSYKPLAAVPENRVYVSLDSADTFIHSFLAFSHGRVISNDEHAPGVEISRPKDTYRRVRIESTFGKMTVLATDGHLPFPYGRETTGYEVANLTDTLRKATNAGLKILVAPYRADQRHAAIVQFPGGYIAEIHSEAKQ
jgi:hypothetical protein